LESIGEMLGNQRRHCACCQQFGERPVALADLSVAETADKLGPTYSERSGAFQAELADQVGVFSVAYLNRC
jgi:hypothetical protein